MFLARKSAKMAVQDEHDRLAKVVAELPRLALVIGEDEIGKLIAALQCHVTILPAPCISCARALHPIGPGRVN